MPLPDLSGSSALLLLAGLYAGTQNVLAGGGSFITYPALLLAGLDPVLANTTSTIALFPNQVTSSLAGRNLAGPVGAVSLARLGVLSVVGGAVGALLLLLTPSTVFARLLPWLLLIATAIFAWGSFRQRPPEGHPVRLLPPGVLSAIQFAIGIYGGYFGGGIGFLMLAALTAAGHSVRMANATKNILAMAMNASAAVLFAFSGHVAWTAAAALAVGGIGGGFAGGYLMKRLPERGMRLFVVLIGTALTIWLFVR